MKTPLMAMALALSAGLTIGAAPGYATSDTRPTPKTHQTTYGLSSTGFGTRVVGGQLPVGSGTMAYQHIGCTNQAGLDKRNDVVDATMPGLGTASGARTRTWTTRKNGVVAAHANHSIVQLVLASTPLGSLAIKAIHSKAKAFHDASGFHAVTSTDVGDIVFTPPVGAPQSFPAPLPGQSLTIPGLATIFAGRTSTVETDTAAVAKAVALEVDVIPTHTDVFVAHSAATIGAGLTYGVFRGHANATRVETAAGNVAHSGPNPLTIMPCQGTGGAVRSKALASLDLGGQVVVSGASSSERGNQGIHRAHGVERAEVARVNLGGGQLVIDGIVGRAAVRRTDHGVVRSTKGTRLGTITANGQPQSFPDTGVLEIPGVATLERSIVTTTPTGVKVIALRITLLDGSGAVIDLGEASLSIHRLPH